MTREELTAWIEDLRGCLERGELYGHPPLQLLPWLRVQDVEAFAPDLAKAPLTHSYRIDGTPSPS